LHRPLWIFGIVAAGLSLALIKRTVAALFPEAYFKLLGWAAVFWISTAVIWLCFILPFLFIVPTLDEFGRMHEEAKKRLLRN
jgi:hypothetical protein